MGNNKQQTREQLAYMKIAHYINYQNENYKLATMYRVIITYLEALERGDIQRLLISIPPRHSKTSLVGEYFTSWYLGRNPSHKIAYSTYSQNRGNDVGRQVIEQVKSDKFKKIFTDFTINNTKTLSHFETPKRGGYINLAVSSVMCGRAINLLLIDDPLKNRQEAESETISAKIKEWYRSAACTRLKPNGKIVIINTRWSENDLTAYILNEYSYEKWTVLNLPAVAEENDILGRKVGEALWPECMDCRMLNEIKKAISHKQWCLLYQQQNLNLIA